MLKERKILEENLIEVLENQVKPKKKLVNQIKDDLTKYDILPGDSQGWIGSASEEVPNLDPKVLALLTEATYEATKVHAIFPKDYFAETEMKRAYQYDASVEREGDTIQFPLTITNATIVGNGSYLVTMNIQTIKKFLSSNLLQYNYDVQREVSYSRRNDKIIIEPTVNKNNVKEISEHLRNSTLVPTVLVFNANTRSSDVGEELIYDPKKMELTITKGTQMDIVDGYHRCLGLQNALEFDPDIDFNFGVLITNFTTKQAQQYQAQLAKATPISRTRVQELEANRYSDTVVNQLRSESDLKGRISQTHRLHTLNNELVTYNILADTIESEFNMRTKVEALDVADYLTDFFNYLIGSFPDEFIENVNETKRESLISDNNMFIGYIVLAKRMFDKDMKVKEIRKILNKIDFSKSNKLWRELDILDSEGNLNHTTKVRKGIRDYFLNLDIS